MILFLYFENCPHAEATWKNLLTLVHQGILSRSSVKKVEEPDLAAAKKYHFMGSPSILIDGIDIYTGKEPDTTEYCCRIYTFDNTKTGILTSQYILKRVKELAPSNLNKDS